MPDPTHRIEQYTRGGLLAIHPSALFESFIFLDGASRENVELGDAVIVDVRGPLEAHAHFCFDSYEAIALRVADACKGTARTVCLRFDSPGGEVSGCFDTAAAIAQTIAAAGKRYVAYVEGNCNSAAYALASHAEHIAISTTSIIGSIGVLDCRRDITARNAANGVRIELITSGARKADGHPDAPITDAELANRQQIVDSMAGVFFELVAAGRGMSIDDIAQLEAKVFHGAAAVAAGLADAVGPLTTALSASAETEDPVATAYEKAKAALEEAAKGNDANAAAAKKALAAMTAGDGDSDKKDGDKPAEGDGADDKKDDKAAEGDKEKPAAATAGDPPADDKKEDKASAAMRIALEAQAKNDKLTAELQRRDEVEERRNLLASREMTDDMRKLLEKAPMTLVREHIKGMPAKAEPLSASANGASTPTLGAGQGAPDAPHLPPEERAKMDARMGLTGNTKMGAVNSTFKLTLGAPVPADDKASN